MNEREILDACISSAGTSAVTFCLGLFFGAILGAVLACVEVIRLKVMQVSGSSRRTDEREAA